MKLTELLTESLPSNLDYEIHAGLDVRPFESGEDMADGATLYCVYVDPKTDCPDWEGGEILFTKDGEIRRIIGHNAETQAALDRDRDEVVKLFREWMDAQRARDKNFLDGLIDRDLNESSEKAEAWIQKMYAKYPKNPINHDQRAIAYDGGEKFVFFELEPSKSAKDAVELKWFQAYPQREGVGTKGLQQIVDDAREDGITLTLFPWQHGRVSQTALMRFYKRLGFKPTAKGAKNMILKHDLTEAVHPDLLREQFEELFEKTFRDHIIDSLDNFAEITNANGKATHTIKMNVSQGQSSWSVALKLKPMNVNRNSLDLTSLYDGDDEIGKKLKARANKAQHDVEQYFFNGVQKFNEEAKKLSVDAIEVTNGTFSWAAFKATANIPPVKDANSEYTIWWHWARGTPSQRDEFRKAAADIAKEHE